VDLQRCHGTLDATKMKIPIPVWYDTIMDVIATIVFPSRKYVTLTLIFYTAALAIGLSWYFDNWIWAPAVIAGMVLGAIMFGEL